MRRVGLAAITLILSASFMFPRLVFSQESFTRNGEVYANYPLSFKRGEGSIKTQSPYKAIGLPKKKVSDAFNLVMVEKI
ncbi:MAG: hypothetical protein QGF74_01705 [Candidatus Nanoarchaeia archaeon]|mgnify:CR=1 FL=1|jgi:hypothetical protein|nr:hypothetical protein [Candidatus Nanoarchaeia archaeon]|tara:strand:+ start:563 stop:799 length:237 start_codon:yes stop_codon:yes gene_type:complete